MKPEEKNSDTCPVWGPLEKTEVIFHPSPGYEYLRDAVCGEAEPYTMTAKTNSREQPDIDGRVGK